MGSLLVNKAKKKKKEKTDTQGTKKKQWKEGGNDNESDGRLLSVDVISYCWYI